MAANHLRRPTLVLAALLTLVGISLGGNAQAERMYTGSLIIDGFANDQTDGVSYPTTTPVNLGIPLIGKCNTGPFHPLETLQFPTTGTPTVTFTIPAYGGQVNEVDTNGDTVLNLPEGCTYTFTGDPLTGSGSINTTGKFTMSRTPNNPRGFTLPKSNLNFIGSGASFAPYGVYLWEVHYADLHNETGVFAKDGGDGDFSFAAAQGTRKAVQTAGKNKFGGVMKLLGAYGDNEGYLYNGITTSVFKFNWLFNYVGAGGQGTTGGVVTNAFVKSTKNYGYTRASGYPITSTVYASVFKWTTGTVAVTAVEGGNEFLSIFTRTGYDNRNATGKGAVQLVSPMLTHWVGAGVASTAAIGVMKIDFVPEPSQLLILSAGASLLGLFAYGRRR
jgi:hypothetical protein